MALSVPYNPILTSNASGSFNTDSTGWVVGTAQDNPSVRNQLAGGVIAQTETLPFFGGIGISEAIPGVVPGPSPVLGGNITRALTLAAAAAGQLTGFSVFDQQYHMVQTPQNEVPIALPGMTAAFYRLGSNARIVVAVDPALVSLDGSVITSQVSWDFGGQKLIKGQAAYAANVTTAASWAATNGGQATFTTTSAHGVGVGVYVTMSGFTPAGYNGTWLTVAGTAGSTLVVAMPVNPGAVAVEGQLNAGGGILPVRTLEIRAANNMTPVYNATTGFVTWNRNGPAALIEI